MNTLYTHTHTHPRTRHSTTPTTQELIDNPVKIALTIKCMRSPWGKVGRPSILKSPISLEEIDPARGPREAVGNRTLVDSEKREEHFLANTWMGERQLTRTSHDEGLDGPDCCATGSTALGRQE